LKNLFVQSDSYSKSKYSKLLSQLTLCHNFILIIFLSSSLSSISPQKSFFIFSINSGGIGFFSIFRSSILKSANFKSSIRNFFAFLLFSKSNNLIVNQFFKLSHFIKFILLKKKSIGFLSSFQFHLAKTDITEEFSLIFHSHFLSSFSNQLKAFIFCLFLLNKNFFSFFEFM